MAEYEKNRKTYDPNRKRTSIERKQIAQLVPQYLPDSQQSQRTIQQQQQQVFSTQTSLATQTTPAVQQQRQQGGLGIFRDVQFASTTTTNPYVKIYDSSIDGELRDIIFVNSDTSVNLTFDLLLSRVDISTLGKNEFPNQVLDINKDSVFLPKNMLLAQAGTAPNNPKQLSLSEIVGTTQILSSGIQKPFYIYVYKTGSTGRLDVTVMK